MGVCLRTAWHPPRGPSASPLQPHPAPELIRRLACGMPGAAERLANDLTRRYKARSTPCSDFLHGPWQGLAHCSEVASPGLLESCPLALRHRSKPVQVDGPRAVGPQEMGHRHHSDPSALGMEPDGSFQRYIPRGQDHPGQRGVCS